ncbi:Kunitz/Bovine pancreatic trypsin inhibitor domain protein [Dictyocaulus viviparus]|uniref:Kunitz/Bovine pancreatic trypsin inhibitor domain protein n=1 Tax=Dictyocaulus viviparus TaxID=29172 RepID=A0A0D8XJE9_DICVI|nr:Kunitz/Bovine pancreatic trypsin inhibitor domain protein [Dictyocaulus viviparus]
MAQHDVVYACESLICDPPKMCIIQNQVAQCLLVLPPTPGTVLPNLAFNGQNTKRTTTQNVAQSMLPGFVPTSLTTTIHFTTTAAPLAPLLNLLGVVGGAPPIVLPTLAPPPATTKTPFAQICSLQPLTGSCGRARIMWYYDKETGKCERFSFSGCGNLNRFPSKRQCEQACIGRE